MPRTPKRRPTRHRARLLAILVGVVAALCAVEAGLQVIAWMQWQGTRSARANSADRPQVLCIGDSFTYGLGAADPTTESYPEVLQALLREHDPAATVVNGGWPGNTSVDVLRTLHARIGEAPLQVCILVGVNDLTRRPAPLSAEEAEAARTGEGRAFRWRWRLPLLVDLVASWWSGGPAYGEAAVEQAVAAGAQSGGEAPFVGRWHAGTLELSFTEDGRAHILGEGYRWRQDGERIHLQADDGATPVETTWRMDGPRLVLSLPRFPELALEPGGAVDPRLVEGRRITAEVGAEAAVEHYRALVAGAPDDPLLVLGMTEALAVAGRMDEARASAADGLRILQAGLAGARVDAVLRAQFEVHDFGRALALWTAHAAEVPPGVLRDCFAQTCRHPSTRAALLAAMQHAATGSELVPALRELSVVLREHAPDESLDVLLSALAWTPAERRAEFVHWSFRSLADLSPDDLEAALERSSLSEARREGIRGAFAQEFGDLIPVLTNLEQHLRRAVALCRAEGAVPILLTYPFPFPRHHELVSRLAEEFAVGRIDLLAGFPAVGSAEHAALFEIDGHCNSAGYARMAALVAAALER